MEPPPQPAASGTNMCLQWAIKGEKAYRAGKVRQGVEFLEKAVEVGTNDLRTLGAVYSQLGSAYTELRNFEKAIQYLSFDLMIAKYQKDREGEAKSVSNISNLYKLQHNYDQAIIYAQAQLDIGKELGNKNTQAVAYYNLGTIYFLRGKESAKTFQAATSTMNSTVASSISAGCNFKEDILKAINNFDTNLGLVEELNDRKACGRAYGSLGNCYYVVRDFEESVKHHTKRLQVAQEYGDKETQRKAYSNLGNAYVFLGDLLKALECYRLALSLAMELDSKSLRNKAIQGQSCFNLASASTLNEEYQLATDYHLRHLSYARELRDTAGEGRGLASLATVYKLTGDFPKAVYFMARRRSLAKQMKDPVMIHAAEVAFKELIEIAGDAVVLEGRELLMDSSADPEASNLPQLRLSVSLTSIHEASDLGLSRRNVFASDTELTARSKTGSSMNNEEDFFDFVSRVQSKRLDDQRCEAHVLTDATNKPPRQRDTNIPSPNESISSNKSRSLFDRVTSTLRRDLKKGPNNTSTPLHKRFSTASLWSYKKKPDDTFSMVNFESEFKPPLPPPPMRNRRHSFGVPHIETPVPPPRKHRKEGPDSLFDQVIAAQSRRMDEQRATLFPGYQGQEELLDQIQKSAELEGGIDEQLLELVARAQGQRMNEQRSELGGRAATDTPETNEKPANGAMTIPEDDLTDLVTRMAKTRFDEQRAHLPEAN